jgi:hypothetical protein
VTHIPIVCTLTAEDRSARGDEWRQFLSSNVVTIKRRGPTAKLLLKPGDDVILTAVDLARREKDCCAFFGFHLELLAEEVWLEVEVPVDAAEILDALLTFQQPKSRSAPTENV